MMNKRGSTLTNWIFVVLAVSLFLVVIQGQVLNPMNNLYSKNLSIGLNTDANSTISSIKSSSNASSADIDSSEISTVSDGVTILQIGAIAKRTFTTLWDFASGRFLYTLLVEQLDMPEIVATVLTIAIWISLIFVMVRIFTRGVTP